MDALSSKGFDDFEIPAFLRKQSDAVVSAGMTPAELIEAFNDAALHARDFDEAISTVLLGDVGVDLRRLVDAMATDVGTANTAWALLLDWLMACLVGQCTLSRHGLRLLRSQLTGVDETTKLLASKRLAAALPALDRDTWGPITVAKRGRMSQRLKAFIDTI